jgi:TIR domain
VPSAFLSHSSLDKDIVRRIATRLRECGVDVWLDERELIPGDTILEHVSDSIRYVDFVAVILSRSALGSPWVKKELSMAVTREIQEERKTVIPILIEECEIPDFLKDKLYANFTDVRKFDEAMIQLLSSLNADIDEYKRRAKCLNLFDSKNIFMELAGLEDRLFCTSRDCSVSRVMLDNATVDYALSAIGHSDVSWWKSVLPSRSDVYAHAVYRLVDALVLYDEVWVGLGGGTQYMRKDLRSAQEVLKDSSDLFSGEVLLALANLSRRQAREQSLRDFAFADALGRMASARLDPKIIVDVIERMTPNDSISLAALLLSSQ